MDVLVTYDISTRSEGGQLRLRGIAGICERYGQRVQYSVFECRLDAIQQQRLITELADALDPDHDSVRIYQLHRAFGDVTITLGQPGHDWERTQII